MCFIFRYLRYSLRNNLCLIVGIIFGIGVSLCTLELFENDCIIARNLEMNAAEVENEDSYEPRINLAGKPLKAQKTPQDFIRPRYYTTELGIREKLFVGILTSPKSFETLGVAVNKTIHHVVNKVMYFSEADGSRKKFENAPNGLVQFSDSRLILKPFHMLKYIADNFLDEFDYFYLINDSSFINGRKLMQLVNGLSLSQEIHLGYKLDFESSFCSLGSGILLSNQLIRKVVSNLDWCVKNAYSESDEANLGRCIVHATDVACTNKVKGGLFIGHPLVNPDLPVEKILKDSSLSDAVTIWPVKTAALVYSLHLNAIKKEKEELKSEIEKLRRAILSTPVVLPGNITDPVTWPVGTPPPSTPLNRFDLLRWDYFTEKHIYLKSDFTNVEDLIGADLLDIQGVLNATIRHIQHSFDGQLVYRKLINGYRRFDPARGLDYVLDVSCKDIVTGEETHKRFEVCKPLGKVELVPVPYVTENTRVNIILIATAENQDNIVKFIDAYAKVCMEKRDKTSLLVVLVYEADHPGKGAANDVHSSVKAAALKQSERFKRDNNKIMWLSVKLPPKPPQDAILTILLLDLAIKKFSSENLILLSSGNAELRQDYLNRVRMNTVKGKQIFSAIPFYEYHPLVVYNEDLPRPKEMDINKNYGHYDVMNQEHISFYVRDFKEARKQIDKTLPTAHTDKDLATTKQGPAGISVYGLFVRYSDLHVLRAVEPSLRLRHVEPSCSVADEVCNERKAFNLGPRGQLGRLLLDFLDKRGKRSLVS